MIESLIQSTFLQSKGCREDISFREIPTQLMDLYYLVFYRSLSLVFVGSLHGYQRRKQGSNNCEIHNNDREIILLFRNCFHCLNTFPLNSKFHSFSGSLAGKKRLRKSWKLLFKFVDKLFLGRMPFLYNFC